VYVHRIGRTGRAGATGLAISLATSGDRARLRESEAASGGRIEHRPLPVAVKAPASAKAQPNQAAADMVTLLVRGGRKDKLRAGDILGALTGEGGCVADQIGRIELHDEFAYVAVTRASARQVAALDRLRIKGRTFRIEGLK